MRALVMSLVLVFPLLAGLAVAHEPDHFSVIVRKDRHDPMEVNLIVNDSVQYINADERENMTHHIGYDKNGDNDFDDDGEFSSGILNNSCDWDNEPDCRTAWVFSVNSTDLIGSFTLIDLMSDGTYREVRLNVGSDDHSTPMPEIGECFGAGCDEVMFIPESSSESGRSSLQNAMILASLITFLISLGLTASILADNRAALAEGGDESEQVELR